MTYVTVVELHVNGLTEIVTTFHNCYHLVVAFFSSSDCDSLTVVTIQPQEIQLKLSRNCIFFLLTATVSQL